MIGTLVSAKVARFKKQNNAMPCNFLCKYIDFPVCFMAAVCIDHIFPSNKNERSDIEDFG